MTGRGRAPRVLAAAVLATLAAGCSGVSTWGRSRLADLADAVPMSAGLGPGIGLSVQTPPISLGIAVLPVRSVRIGYDDRLVHGVWREFQTGLPWSLWLEGDGEVPRAPRGGTPWWRRGAPLMYRWQAMRDWGHGEPSRVYEPELSSWGTQPPVVREFEGAFLTLAEQRAVLFRDLRRVESGPDEVPLDAVGSPWRGTLWVASRGGPRVPRHWLQLELDVTCFLGLRLGLRPWELVDWVVGFVGLDVSGDDLPTPRAFEPRPLG